MSKLLLMLGAVSAVLLAAPDVPSFADDHAFICRGPAPGPTGMFIDLNVKDIVVPPNAECTIARGTVTGNVTVMNEATFTTHGSDIRGNINGLAAAGIFVDGGAQVGKTVETVDTPELRIGGSTVGGVQVDGTNRILILGSSVTVVHDVQIEHSLGALVIEQDVIGGDVRVDRNTPSYFFLQDNSTRNVEVSENTGYVVVQVNVSARMEVSENTGVVVVNGNQGRSLRCEGNGPSLQGGPNTFTRIEGQCF